MMQRLRDAPVSFAAVLRFSILALFLIAVSMALPGSERLHFIHLVSGIYAIFVGYIATRRQEPLWSSHLTRWDEMAAFLLLSFGAQLA